jgi:hypothetical protein
MTGRPDFFIVGAPKCGTTALYHYLRQHPDIYFAPKEIHYFGSDLTFRENDKRPRTEEQYLECFSRAAHENMLGDASVWYLYSKEAAREIKRFSPAARIIIMLRNPIDMLYSNYSQNRWNGDEDIRSFQLALDAEPDRRQGKRLPRTTAPGPVEALFYLDTARFSEQIQRYFMEFGEDRVHIIFYDDFAKETALVYRSVLGFLGIDEGFQAEIAVVNSNKVIASELFWRFVKSPPSWLRGTWQTILPAKTRKSILRFSNKLNKKEAARPPMNAATRDCLKRTLEPEVERLSRLLGRDLSGWCN